MNRSRIEERPAPWSELALPQVDAARRRLEAMNKQATRLIVEHPVACLLGALSLGYLVARLARRFGGR